MKKFFSEFKKFISKGNILDLAIAVVVGGAFSKIVTSLVNDIIMPFIGLATGGASVQDLKWVIKAAVYQDGVLVTAENALRYGLFLQAIIDFLIISFFIFVAFKVITASTKRLEKVKEELLEKLKKHDGKEEGTENEVHEEVKAETLQVLNDAQRQEVLLTEIRDLLKAQVKEKENEWFSSY